MQKIECFKGKVAIVTGSATGFGRALSLELGRLGANVVVTDRHGEGAQRVCDVIVAEGGQASAHELDVRDSAAVASVVHDTFNSLGTLDYIFNNAGIAVGGFTHRFAIEDWDDIIDVNLKGVVNGVHAAYPLMLSQGFGHIINTGSVTGLMPGPAAYAATKHAITGLSLSLRHEAALRNVRVSVICPGAIQSPMLKGGGRYGKHYDVPADIMEDYWKNYQPVSPDYLARVSLEQIAKNKDVILAPSYWRVLWWLYRIFPGITESLVRKRYVDMINSLEKVGIDIYSTEPKKEAAAVAVEVEPNASSRRVEQALME